MADLEEEAVWEPGIFQLELNTVAMGGPGGVSNRPAKQLANRTAWLKEKVDQAVDESIPGLDERLEALEAGVTRVRTVADVAELAALEAEAGEIALIGRSGVYRYEPSSVLPESLPWVVESAQGGRWEHALTESLQAILTAGTFIDPGSQIHGLPREIVWTKTPARPAGGKLYFQHDGPIPVGWRLRVTIEETAGSTGLIGIEIRHGVEGGSSALVVLAMMDGTAGHTFGWTELVWTGSKWVLVNRGGAAT